MLGKYVKAKILTPADRYNGKYRLYCPLPFGAIDGAEDEVAFFLDECESFDSFEGIVIALLEPAENAHKNASNIWLVAKSGTRYIASDIEAKLDAARLGYEIKKCIFESSAGAIVYKKLDRVRFLLVRNRNANWGFPKGHIEKGETKYDAARREVLEEAGVHVKIHLGFEGVSRYKIRDSIDKKVSIFVGTTDDEETVIQESEISGYDWLPFHAAIQRLKFDNDIEILIDAEKFLIENGYIENEYPHVPPFPDRFYRGHEAQGLAIHNLNKE
ncbi:MAG: NUDIX domain-containing protein [Eubacterium sp.]|nr:NUDIX domain-containing protein [Eubacterium sp.]